MVWKSWVFLVALIVWQTFAINTTELDCQMRRLAVQYAKEILEPWWGGSRGNIHRQNFAMEKHSNNYYNKRHHHHLNQHLKSIHDALRLKEWCGVPYLPSSMEETSPSEIAVKQQRQLAENKTNISPPSNEDEFAKAHCQETNVKCLFVVPGTEDLENEENDGSMEKPCYSLHQAIRFSRRWKQQLQQNNVQVPLFPWKTKVILRQGIHSLGRRGTIRLGPDDTNLEIIGFPNEDVWISGAISIPSPPTTTTTTCQETTTPQSTVDWKRWQLNSNIWVANLTNLLNGTPDDNIPYTLPKVISLFTTTPHRRLIRARYPNGDPELAQWGYASPDRFKYSIPTRDVVLEWMKPPPGGKPPTFTFVDLRRNTNHTPSKNDSMQLEYNMFASGHGGVCSDVWGENADSYWCSNASSGGWAEVDQEAATTGRLQIPVAMRYNTSHPIGRRIGNWSAPWAVCNNRPVGVGGIVHAWHSQSWAMHMFEIDKMDQEEMTFAKGGGNQGGRNWCRCDQCTYAGNPWCGQFQTPANNSDDRLIGDMWMAENILSELDDPGEFFVDRESGLLYLWPNATTTTTTTSCGCSPLRLPLFERLIEIHGAINVSIVNVGFRDTAPTYLGEWSAPSGGDWSMHRGGAVFIEDSERITIQSCTFRRLDGTAIFLSRRTRNIVIEGNVFQWLGESAIATWGHTDDFDATSGSQPHHTLIQYNIMSELGLYQKQSSALGQAKAAQTVIRNNVMFNMPRAAINFNDMMGGGDVVTRNVIFNTCRESGDHGGINTWDRSPFMTTLGDGKTASFVPLPRVISHNFVFANYGASQGVDNDDGSSWYHIFRNVFYSAEGFKMDYGGHDSRYEDNLIMAYPYDGQQCVNFASFFPGHGHTVRGNKCIVGLDPPAREDIIMTGFKRNREGKFNDNQNELVVQLEQCSNDTVTLMDNQYYTPMGTAIFRCYNEDPQCYQLGAFQDRFGLELGSTFEKTPSEDTLHKWAWSILF